MQENFTKNDKNIEQNNRLCVLSVMVENRASAQKLNEYLSQYGEYIVGRMGIPYKQRSLSVLCVILDAPLELVNALTGKIGRLDGVSAKTLFGKN